jgi:prepilin-type N-terminal cleavage/methylation domain-containing protein
MVVLAKTKGFTLLEVLMALSITAIGILVVIQMQIVAIKANSSANKLSVMSSIAQQALDDILSWDVTNPVFAPPGPFSDKYQRMTTFLNNSSVTIPSAGKFTANYSIILQQPDLGTATIIVTVADPFGRTVTLRGIKRIT